jgi:predicted phosphodiesterase
LDCIKKIITKEKPSEVIQLGDFFDKRSPSPEAVLSAKNLIDFMASRCDKVVIIRGNHDSSTKSDNEVTILNVFESDKVFIINKITRTNNAVFIPHYEDEEIIINELSQVPKSSWVFSHIGYKSCLNSLGDEDFQIPFSKFKNPTILGHIHKHNQTSTECCNGDVTVMGTPYTTSYTEHGKRNVYGMIINGELEIKDINHGLRYYVCNYEDLNELKEEISDKNYGTRLRVFLGKLENVDSDNLIKSIISEFGVDYVDIKYMPVFSDDEDAELSSFTPDKSMVTITDDIIQSYVDGANTTIDKESLMAGLRLLKNEYKENNNT